MYEVCRAYSISGTIVIALLFPVFVSGLTVDEIRAQIQGILARIEILKMQVGSNGALNAASSTPPLPSGLPCLSLSRMLSAGSQGDDVRELQRFLIKAGLLAGDSVTGYFGILTEAAVQKFQTLQGIVSSGTAATTGFGMVGPKTRASILARCARNDPVPGSRTCPGSVSPPLSSECPGTWEKGYDASGCLTGYQCVFSSPKEASAPALSPVAPNITVTAPAAGTIVTGGNTLNIEWRSISAPPGAGVSLALLDPESQTLGAIVENVAVSGTYLWRVPSEENDCSVGESAFDCIAKFAHCEGTASLCSIPPGTYVIRATLSNFASTTSAPFQIAGSAIGSLLKALVGAPVVPPPAREFSSTSTSAQAGMCTHDGSSYPQGATLSVPCVAGHCPASGTGFITGACSQGGQWCIPSTSYCASVLTQIDVSAYEGGGASAIGSGYSIGCPQEGWRAYLSCPYGGCTTGWNICRGGSWVLDTVQQTVIVGMQGSCQSGEVWCGIGTGFGCVAAPLCINGSAL